MQHTAVGAGGGGGARWATPRTRPRGAALGLVRRRTAGAALGRGALTARALVVVVVGEGQSRRAAHAPDTVQGGSCEGRQRRQVLGRVHR